MKKKGFSNTFDRFKFDRFCEWIKFQNASFSRNQEVHWGLKKPFGPRGCKNSNKARFLRETHFEGNLFWRENDVFLCFLVQWRRKVVQLVGKRNSTMTRIICTQINPKSLSKLIKMIVATSKQMKKF